MLSVDGVARRRRGVGPCGHKSGQRIAELAIRQARPHDGGTLNAFLQSLNARMMSWPLLDLSTKACTIFPCKMHALVHLAAC